jgi:hypothetical protein
MSVNADATVLGGGWRAPDLSGQKRERELRGSPPDERD